MPQTDMKGYVPAIRRWWPTLLAAAVTAGVVGAAMSIILPDRYEARSQLLVGPVNASADAQRTAGTLARTYAELIVSETFLTAAVDELGLSETPEDLREERVQASGSTQTRFVVITANQTDPQRAADLVNFLADRLIAAARQGSRDSPEGIVTVIDRAVPPTEASGPSLPILAGASALAGLISMLLFIIATEHFSDRVRDADDLVAASGAELLGTISLKHADPDSLTPKRRDALRPIVNSLLAIGEGGPSAVTIVPVDSDVASELVPELARAASEYGKRVVVVDGVTGAARPMGASYRMASAPLPGGVVGAIDLERAAAVLDAARKGSDLVLVAAPAIAASPAGLVWGAAAGSSILVAEARGSTRAAVHEAAVAISAAGGKLTAVIATTSGSRLRRRPATLEATPQRVTSSRSRG